MTADPYVDRRYDDDGPYHPNGAASYGDGWDDESTPTVPQKARRRMPDKKDLAARMVHADLGRSAPLFVAVPALLFTVIAGQWLPVATTIRVGSLFGFGFVAFVAGIQTAAAKSFRRRALLALWVLVALGTCWMVAA